MTYLEIKKPAHSHRFFVDNDTRDLVCLCGITKGANEKRAKYHNRSSEYNGVIYHSQLESKFAAELDWRVKCKDIKRWERQVRLDLKVNGMHITNYFIDFIIYHNDGSREFTECKGLSLGEWRLKWLILQATFEDFKKDPDDRLTVIKQYPSRFRYKKPR